MAKFFIRFIHFAVQTYLIICSKVTDIKIKIHTSFINFSDPTFIQTIVKDGFNYDLRKEEDSKPDVWFFIRMIRFFLIWTAFSYQIYGSYHHWSDQSQILRFGIFFPGMGAPREVTIPCAIVVQISILNLTSSVWVLTHNPAIHCTMTPLRAICHGSNQVTSISREVVSQVRKDIRPVVALARALAITNSIVFFFLSFFSSILHIQEPIGPRNSELGTRNSIEIVKTEISSSSTNSDRNMNSSCDMNEKAKKVFLAVMAEQVEVVNSVRKWSTFLNLIIGLNLTFLLSVATIGTFFDVAYDNNLALLAGFPLVIFCWISFTIVIRLVSNIPVTVSHATVEMSRMADKIAWLPGERLRVNRTLSAMLHRNGFSAFGFTSQINRAMMITVRYTVKNCN